MLVRVAAIRSSARVVASLALVFALMSPAFRPPAAIAEEGDPDPGRMSSPRSQFHVPDQTRTGDDDQPTIGGGKQGREFPVTTPVTAFSTTVRPVEPAPQAPARQWFGSTYWLWFLMRLGVMLR